MVVVLNMNAEFNKSKFIGNSAENIIEFLINSMPDWKCIRFGVENHIEQLKEIVREEINETTKRIKSMPDFIAYNSKTKQTCFIEVKYRSFIERREGKSEYHLDFLKEYLNYWKGTKLIVVNPNLPPHLFFIDLDNVNLDMCRKEQVSSNKWNYYWDFKEIEKGIKDLFPDLKDETINEALKMVLNK